MRRAVLVSVVIKMRGRCRELHLHTGIRERGAVKQASCTVGVCIMDLIFFLFSCNAVFVCVCVC